MSARLRLVLAAFAALLVGTGCATPGVPVDELPVRPIALLYWEPEEARRRAEILAENTQPKRRNVGVAAVEDLGDLIGGRAGREGAAAQLAQWPGRVVLLHPRTGRIERLSAIWPGARPMAWSADGQRLLFVSAHLKRRPQLYEYDRELGEVRPLTRGPESHPAGDYGPGRAFVYTGIRVEGENVQSRLYLHDPAARGTRALSKGHIFESPRLTPDGAIAVFGRRQDRGLPSLVAQRIETGEERVIGPGRAPVISPDGKWLVYSAPTRAGWRLRRIRTDGSARSPLGQGSHDEHAPAVSPDSRLVAYVAREAGLDRLFLKRLDGSGDRLLLGEGAVSHPVW